MRIGFRLIRRNRRLVVRRGCSERTTIEGGHETVALFTRSLYVMKEIMKRKSMMNDDSDNVCEGIRGEDGG